MFFFFQAEDGIRDLVRSRGLGDVYKRQHPVGGPVVVDGHDRSEGARTLGQPGQLLLLGARHEVEGGHAVGDLVVVDAADLLGVGRGGEAQGGDAHVARVACRNRRAPNGVPGR